MLLLVTRSFVGVLDALDAEDAIGTGIARGGSWPELGALSCTGAAWSGLRVVGVKRSTVTVPDVVGFDATDACEMVRAAGLVPYGPAFGPVPTSGTVLAQDPVASAVAERAAAVVVWTQGRDTADALVAPPTPAEAENPESP